MHVSFSLAAVFSSAPWLFSLSLATKPCLALNTGTGVTTSPNAKDFGGIEKLAHTQIHIINNQNIFPIAYSHKLSSPNQTPFFSLLLSNLVSLSSKNPCLTHFLLREDLSSPVHTRHWPQSLSRLQL